MAGHAGGSLSFLPVVSGNVALCGTPMRQCPPVAMRCLAHVAGTSVRQRPTSTSGGMLAVDAGNQTVLVNNGSKGIEKNLTFFLGEIERRFQGTEKNIDYFTAFL